MMTKSTHDSPILVTGAAGAIGAIGRNLTAMLVAKGHKVRALVRREDERADALRRLGAEVVQGDLTDLASMHRAIKGCARIYFGMSVSPVYLEVTVNTALAGCGKSRSHCDHKQHICIFGPKPALNTVPKKPTRDFFRTLLGMCRCSPTLC